MKKLLPVLMLLIPSFVFAQKPCATDPMYRQFDFWVGTWEAYSTAGKKAGDSKISIILDSCIVLEEWTSTAPGKGVTYAGKSFNTYNAATKQWQQQWVDNVGGSTAYMKGKLENHVLVFESDPFNFKADTVAIRRLSFFDLGPNTVRQLGEITKDKGVTWATEFDLEYRRRKN